MVSTWCVQMGISGKYTQFWLHMLQTTQNSALLPGEFLSKMPCGPKLTWGTCWLSFTRSQTNLEDPQTQKIWPQNLSIQDWGPSSSIWAFLDQPTSLWYFWVYHTRYTSSIAQRIVQGSFSQLVYGNSRGRWDRRTISEYERLPRASTIQTWHFLSHSVDW